MINLRRIKYLSVFLLLLCFSNVLFASNKDTLEFEFTTVADIPTTEVKNQGRSGTCWSFAAISFFETELLRIQQQEYDFSEMYVVRMAYIEKAKKYIRLHGNVNFSSGGEANDVLDVFDRYGFYSNVDYSGLLNGSNGHNHNALDAELKNYVDSILLNYNEEIARTWTSGFENLLDKHLGTLPTSATLFQNTQASQKSYIPFNTDDYVLFTSFTHHPFYESIVLELPDNWSWEQYYNLPIDELKMITDSALINNYSVVWAADYSEQGFLYRDGIAVAPHKLYNGSKYNKSNKKKQRKMFSDFSNPVKELEVTQEFRQIAFDNHTTTDDHLMHIVGKVEGPTGKQYYTVKNSWGTNNPLGGFFYVSEPYFSFKTISVMVHKDAVPEIISAKISAANCQYNNNRD